MSVTLLVSQLEISWLNVIAPWNMDLMFVTAPVFQFSVGDWSNGVLLLRGWSNAFARLNIEFMDVTALVFHFPMG
jgi:hypothetical protein